MLYPNEHARLRAILNHRDCMIFRRAPTEGPAEQPRPFGRASVDSVLRKGRIVRIEKGTDDILHVEGRERSWPRRKFRVVVRLDDEGRAISVLAVGRNPRRAAGPLAKA